MSRTTLAVVIVIVGLIIIAVSLGAGYIGLSPSTLIGTRKLIGGLIGLIVVVAGIVLSRYKRA